MNKQRRNLLFRQEQLLRQINATLDLLQGSLHKNPSQRGYHLTTKVEQKTVTKYVRQELVPRVRAMALGTALGRWHRNDLIQVLGFGPLPGRMAQGSAALFALSGGALRGWSGRDFAAFELTAVQRVELGFKLLVLAFQFPVATFSLIDLLVARYEASGHQTRH